MTSRIIKPLSTYQDDSTGIQVFLSSEACAAIVAAHEITISGEPWSLDDQEEFDALVALIKKEYEAYA